MARASVGNSDEIGVTLWLQALDAVDADQVAQQRTLLSAAEQEQCASMVNARRLREFVLGRSLARRAVAALAHCSEQQVRFDVTEHGYLTVSSPMALPPVHFNISHSSDVVACAACQGWAVGLDIERIRPRVDPLEISQRFFAESEARELCALPEAHRLERFLSFWTLKEALAKAHGLGLSMPFDRSRFTLETPGGLGVEASGEPFRPGTWLGLTSPTTEHRLALAVLCDPRHRVQVRVAEPSTGPFTVHDWQWRCGRLNATPQHV